MSAEERSANVSAMSGMVGAAGRALALFCLCSATGTARAWVSATIDMFTSRLR